MTSTRYRDELASLRDDTSLRGKEFCGAYTALADGWLRELWDGVADGAGDGAALLAVGGYGRREMCPGSDLDLLLVQPGRRARPEIAELAQSLWYPLWDSGLKLGHAVRTAKEALALAAEDLDTATALLDARLVAGDPDVAADLARRAAEQWRARSARWMATLGQRVADRHAAAGEVAFLLEPDLKEARGGLRELPALQALALAQAADVPSAEGPGAYAVLLDAG